MDSNDEICESLKNAKAFYVYVPDGKFGKVYIKCFSKELGKNIIKEVKAEMKCC